MPRCARSASPTPSRNSGSSGRRDTNRDGRSDGLEVVVQRVSKEMGVTLRYPTLTRTNYAEWALMMRVNLQAQGVLGAIKPGGAEYREDRMALAAILQAVPPEMLPTLATKDSAKSAWEAVRTMRVGVERVREAKAQTLRNEFESIRMKDNESVDDFGMRLTSIVNGIRALGDTLEDEQVVKKFLRVVPPKYQQVAISIEQLLDLKTMPIEELIGHLKVVEERYDDSNIGGENGRLLLTEEEWVARMKKREKETSSGGGKGAGNGASGRNSHDRSKHGGHGKESREGKEASSSSGGRDKSKIKCFNCGILGHYSSECRKPRRERKEQVHLTQGIDDEPALLMAQVSALNVTTKGVTDTVELDEVHAQVHLGRKDDHYDGAWYLDTGASNHMTGSKDVFAELDTGVTGSIKFGDGSVVDIRGRGTVLFTCHNGEHRALIGVYFIPRLHNNIISIGQLDENGCQVLINDGVLKVRDRQQRLLAKVNRANNHLYVLTLDIVQPVCLAARLEDVAWRWHARFGHLNFEALRKLARSGMVRGLPQIEQVNQICDSCLAGKHRRSPFPQEAKYRAENLLDLVHGDLCGPITPATPGGKRYFLLLVDDLSRYMWLTLLKSKSEAPAAIKHFQANAEVETGRKLWVLRTDRGGEFTSTAFGEYCADRGVKQHLTAPYSPQQNGVVERRNQTVVAMARSLLKAKGMPAEFWGEAVTTAAFILNRSPTRSVEGMTPYEAWHGHKPNVHFLRTFGCVAHVKVIKPNLKKLDDRSTPMVFIGYEPGTKAYRVYDPVAKPVHVTRDIVFDEAAQWDWSAQGTAATVNSSKSFTVEYTMPPQPGVERVDSPVHGTGKPSTPVALTSASGGTKAAPCGVEFVLPPTNASAMLDDDHDGPRRFSDSGQRV